MSSVVPLSFERHGMLRLRDAREFYQFKSQHLIPVVAQEFQSLASEFPLIFVRHSESGEFVPVAMMGLNREQNLYCQNAVWCTHVVPMGFAIAPISVTVTRVEHSEAVAYIDEDSHLLSKSSGEPLFDHNGERTSYLQKRIDQAVTMAQHTLQTRAICKFLADRKLLEARPLTLQHTVNSPRYEVEGLFMINEEAIEGLDDAQFLELRQHGLLPIIYSHLTSLHQLRRLSQLQFEVDRVTDTSVGDLAQT